ALGPAMAGRGCAARWAACGLSLQDEAAAALLRYGPPVGAAAASRAAPAAVAGGAARGGGECVACCVLYLHGFPDQSLDHRQELASHGALRGQLPRQLRAAVLEEVEGSAFCAFNFSEEGSVAGTPGSDGGCPFAAKTVSREVADARAVIGYLREFVAPAPAPIHVVGISTGAIIASLLRGCDEHMTVTAIAGLVDVVSGLRYDFDAEQLTAFDRDGCCWKEFWLPPGSPSNPPAGWGGHDDIALSGATEEARWQKTALRLSARYREDFLGLDVAGAVRRGRSPLLVVHGDKDKSVPLASGEALFTAAAEPKELVVIRGGDHLLRSTKHLRRASTIAAILELIRSTPAS
ncbi:unnamed protein product, partial [Prorocentrum cordatum]